MALGSETLPSLAELASGDLRRVDFVASRVRWVAAPGVSGKGWGVVLPQSTLETLLLLFAATGIDGGCSESRYPIGSLTGVLENVMRRCDGSLLRGASGAGSTAEVGARKVMRRVCSGCFLARRFF